MRYLCVSIFIHVLVISFVWVGFSVSGEREKNSFTYSGEQMAGTEQHAQEGVSSQLSKSSDVTMWEGTSPAYFTPWLKMRQVDKPR